MSPTCWLRFGSEADSPRALPAVWSSSLLRSGYEGLELMTNSKEIRQNAGRSFSQVSSKRSGSFRLPLCAITIHVCLAVGLAIVLTDTLKL